MLACRSSWVRVVSGAGVLVTLVMVSEGCTVDVSLGFDACEYDGATYQVGESFDAGDGCNTCSCTEGGQVACTAIACVACEDPSPECPQPGAPNCSAEAICDLNGGWQCIIKCDECTGGPPPCAAPPMGCTMDGPVCVNGNWQCGAIKCPEGCFYGGEVHAFGEVFADFDGCNQCTCFEDGTVGCTDQACPTCGTEPPMCQVPDPSCTAYPVCTDGTNWECYVDCLPAFCMDPEPICPLGPPNCSYTAVCTDMGWICQDFCMPACPDPEPICDLPPGCEGGAVCGPMGWECQLTCQ